MSRRRFLGSLAVTTVAGVGLARCMVDPHIQTFAQTPVAAGAGAAPPGPTVAGLLPPPPPSARVRLPGGGVLSQLPGKGDLLALTVDDGTNSEV
ncbi:MAG: twin-arginine translocation signal domain-containing protein, partial [Mycobacteriaceae bacterium]|nr:twin-arginine translocation signal domain-containing protein [Mycobacteriaceae bacterium]